MQWCKCSKSEENHNWKMTVMEMASSVKLILKKVYRFLHNRCEKCVPAWFRVCWHVATSKIRVNCCRNLTKSVTQNTRWQPWSWIMRVGVTIVVSNVKFPACSGGKKMGSSKHAKLKTHTKYAEKMIVAVFEMPKLSYWKINPFVTKRQNKQ